MGQDVSTKQVLEAGAGAAAESYEAGFASEKLSPEQYAKGVEYIIDRSNS